MPRAHRQEMSLDCGGVDARSCSGFHEAGARKTTCFCFPDTSANQTPLQQNLNKLGAVSISLEWGQQWQCGLHHFRFERHSAFANGFST